MINDAAGTEFTISPSQVIIGDQVFKVPSTPPPSTSVVSQGGYSITFRARPLQTSILQAAMSHPAQEYARRVATDYIGFCESATESAARLFIAILHFYARDAAPSADEAEELLGPEGNATDAIRLAARELDMNFYTDPRQEAWEGFLEQVLHVQDNNEDPGSLPDNPTPAQYIERAFTGCPGADDFCQRVPWRTEALLNLARFLSQDNWTSLSTLFSFLKKYKSTYIGIDPTGIEGLKSGAGSLTSGLAGFSIMSRIRLSVHTELFTERSWFFTPVLETPVWYFEYLTDFLDRSAGDKSGDFDFGLSYFFKMNMAQAEPIIGAFENANDLIEATWICDSLEERVENSRRFNGGMFSRGNQTYGLLHPRDYQEDPVPPYFYHQRLMTAKSTDQQPLGQQPYRRDSTGGEGITVFIIDAGFDLSGQGVGSTIQLVAYFWNELTMSTGIRTRTTWKRPRPMVLYRPKQIHIRWVRPERLYMGP